MLMNRSKDTDSQYMLAWKFNAPQTHDSSSCSYVLTVASKVLHSIVQYRVELGARKREIEMEKGKKGDGKMVPDPHYCVVRVG